MIHLKPSLKKLRVVAGEGRFHSYRLLASGRRSFLFAKYLVTTFAYYRGKGGSATARTIAYVKGVNQLRYHRHVSGELSSDFGRVQPFTPSRLSGAPECSTLPRITISDVLQQTYFLLLMLLTGRRRYLNLYFLAFAAAVENVVESGMQGVETFFCYNDQPFDVAAILCALNARANCRTIVIQHGLVLSENFYFPSVAKEFWAWGELSRKHYRAWDSAASIVIKGRYGEDALKKRDQFVLPAGGEPLRILVAPSYFHQEVKKTLASLNKELGDAFGANVSIAVKFHPATKFVGLLKLWCMKNAPTLGEESEPMEALSEKYDVLVTKNSTSAVDFLLRGKPVFFLEPRLDDNFPSVNYGFELRRLNEILGSSPIALNDRNASRRKFIEIALNV